MNGFSAIVLKPESETDSLGLLMHSVGGVPLLLRTFLALQRAGCEHIIYLDDDPDGGLKALQRDKRVRARIEWLSPEALKEAKLEKGQIAIVPSNTVFDYQILRELDDLDESGCLKISESGILICGAGRAAEFCQNPSLSDLEGGETVEFTTDRYWHRIQSEDDIKPALQQIYKSLADNEGGLEGFLDHVITRRFSILFTRMLIPFPISPNLVTCLSFLTGLVALYFFSLPGYMNKIWGAVLLQVSTVIDHSDGEIARLKFQTSRFGGTLDIVLDQIIYTLLMLAIGLGVAADHGQTYFWLGVACSFGSLMGCLYTTINQLFETRILALVEKPEEEVVESESKFSRMIETFGTREFGYYLLFVTAIDKLHWLLWVFAIGVQFFWIILTVLYLTEHRKARKAVANA